MSESRRQEEKFKAMDEFRIDYDDLPDGAFFAMAEEWGFSAEDWLWFTKRMTAKKTQAASRTRRAR